MCDQVVCCGVYSGIPRVPRCVCVCRCGAVCKTDPALVLQVCLGLGRGHLSLGSWQHRPSCRPLSLQRQKQVSGLLCCFNTVGHTRWSVQGSVHLSGGSSPRCTPASPTPRSQRVLRIPGGSACPSGHWQEIPVLRHVTCRGPVWRGHLRRVVPALLAAEFRGPGEEQVRY